MLNFNASVLNTPCSTRRISRRITFSRVVVLPTNVIRLTKYCFPSRICIVTSTVCGPVAAALTPSPAFSAAGASVSPGSGSSLNLYSG